MKTLKTLTVITLVILAVVLFINKDNLFPDSPDYELNSEPIASNYNEPETETSSGYNVGDKATDFTLKNVDGRTVSLSDYNKGKGAIVIFTCNHCPYSVAYEDRIIELNEKFKNKGYPVIAINPNNPESYPDDSFSNMKIRAQEKGFTFPYLMDADQKIYPQYGATKTPHVFLLQFNKQVPIVKYIGAIDDNHKDANAVKNHFLQDAVNALLAGEDIKQTRTAAIGCSIKR